MTITMYTKATSPYCKMLKDYLHEKDISFVEKTVDQDEEARDEMSKDSGGFLGVPFLVIEKEEGTKDTVIGFDKNKINSLLGIS